MKNKTRFFFMMATLALWGLLSCTNDDNPHLQDDSIVNTNIDMTEMECITQMASTLNEVISDPDILSFLREEASKQIDGDFNVLLAHAMENTTPTKSGLTLFELIQARLESTATRSSSNNDFAQFVEIFKKNAPLLSLYMPDWQDFENETDFYTVVLDPTFNDGADSILNIFNKNGELVELIVGEEEPEVPYMVIGINERIVIDPESGTKSENLTPIFTSEYHSYYLPTQFQSTETTDLPTRAYAPHQTAYRSAGDTDSYEVIATAQFTSKSAVRSVEGWWRGQPEVECIVIYSKKGSLLDWIVGQTGSMPVNMGDDWYSGNRNQVRVRPNDGEWYIMKWGRYARETEMKYMFAERDNNFSVNVNNLLQLDIGGGDLIGHQIVDFADRLGDVYPVGSIFNFTVGYRR